MADASEKKYQLNDLDPETAEDWDCEDWCWVVCDTERDDEVVCVCSSQAEAAHIADLLNSNPYKNDE